MRRARMPVALVALLVVSLGLGGLASGEVAQKRNVRIQFKGKLAPKALPRTGSAPVRVSVAATVRALKASHPPRLRKISIAINDAGKFAPGALPACTVPDIQPSTTRNALRACRRSLVGTGRFAAKILLPRQASFPAEGKLYAFNGRFHGHPAILAHVFGSDPVPTSFTLPFVLTHRKGRLGTLLTASLANATGTAGYITELSLHLRGRRGRHGTPYVSAGCPAPKRLGSAVFPFAKATFEFAKFKLGSTLTRSCKVRR